MEKNPLLYIGLAVALLLGGIGAYTGVFHPAYAVIQHTIAGDVGSTGEPSDVYINPLWQSGGESIGPTGTFDQNSQFGTCNLIGGTSGIGATTTANFDCAVTGIKAGDTVFGDPSASLPVGALYDFPIIKAVASTTNGYITFTVLNLSGAASTTLGTPVTNGIEYFTQR